VKETRQGTGGRASTPRRRRDYQAIATAVLPLQTHRLIPGESEAKIV